MPEKNSFNNGKMEKLRLHVSDLRAGMYVCELDRPWLETPFPIHGFEVKNDEAIDEIKQYCLHVQIDLDRSKMDDVVIELLPPGTFLNKTTTSFKVTELEQAELVRRQTTNLVKTYLDEIRFGSSPDMGLAKEAVSECVGMVLRNPEIMMFLVQIRSKEGYTGQEAFNVCIYALLLGQLLGFSKRQLESLGLSGLLHDMGKVSIPDDILNKTGKLTDEELAIIQTHSLAGRDILLSSGTLPTGTVEVAYAHHENLDGSGYPRGLQGEQLSMNCKIIGVVDKYDSITSTMPFRPARDHLRAVYILDNLSKQNKIDSNVTSLLTSYLGFYPAGTIVELTSKEVGIVIDSDPEKGQRPQLLLVRDSHKEPIQRFVDLKEKTVDNRGRPYRIAAVRRTGDFGINPSHYFNIIMQSLE